MASHCITGCRSFQEIWPLIALLVVEALRNCRSSGGTKGRGHLLSMVIEVKWVVWPLAVVASRLARTVVNARSITETSTSTLNDSHFHALEIVSSKEIAQLAFRSGDSLWKSSSKNELHCMSLTKQQNWRPWLPIPRFPSLQAPIPCSKCGLRCKVILVLHLPTQSFFTNFLFSLSLVELYILFKI